METNTRDMKKLIIMMLFASGLQAQNLTIQKLSQNPLLVLGSNVSSEEPLLVNVELKQKIEIDGHLIKFPIYFKATLDGIEIYDGNKIQYQKRKCNKEKCEIIHLELKNDYTINGSIRLSPWLVNNITPTN